MTSPLIFGPITWRYIHFVAERLDYLINRMEQAHGKDEPTALDSYTKASKLYAYLDNIESFLPCPGCANNYRRHIHELPLPHIGGDLKDIGGEQSTIELVGEKHGKKRPFYTWSVMMHNKVNVMNGKDELTIEEAEEVQRKYWYNGERENELYHADTIRREDHARISELKQELSKYDNDNVGRTVSMNTYAVTIISIVVVSLSIILYLQMRNTYSNNRNNRYTR